MKIALVHDYLREYGGAERVVEVLHEMYPDAPLYTSFVDWDALGSHAARFRSWEIKTTWVQHNWLVKKYHSPLRFLTPLIWESLDLREFDVVISSSGWFICRGVKTAPSTLHISYIHHPPRNLYGYPTGRPQSAAKQLYGAVINPFLRRYDFATAQRVNELVANSEETRRRVRRFYKRDATVIYPPVKVKNEKLKIKNETREYYLSVGRLTYAKRVDLAIKACNELQLPLKIVGVGRELGYLRSIAGPTIEFLGEVSDAALSGIYVHARALIFCALAEDFGMVPVEAMGHGVPVVAIAQGGVLETVVTGKTGLFFDEVTSKSLIAALQKFQTSTFSAEACIRQAQKFSEAVFKQKMQAFVAEKYQKFAK